jgi:DNA-binding transcriptional LysR family regulator
MGDKLSETRRKTFLPSIVEVFLLAKEDDPVFRERRFDRGNGRVRQIAGESDIADLRPDAAGQRANIETYGDYRRTLKLRHGAFLSSGCHSVQDSECRQKRTNAIVLWGYIESDIGYSEMNGTDRIERRLKLHDLRVLMSVVECGSMAKAAEQLGTSQPAISRAIADLEFSLGVRLLDRGPQGVAPTPFGRALIKRSVAAFDELRLGVKDLEFLADPSVGEVRIAAPIAIAAGFAAAALDRLARLYPRINCHLVISETYRELEQRHVDLVIAFIFRPLAESHLEAELLYRDSLLVVASAKNPCSRRRRLSLADLMNEPWTLPPRDSTHGAAFAEIFRAAGLDMPAATVVSTSGVARTALVAEGRFLTMTAESVYRFAGRDVALTALPVKLPATYRPLPVGIITLKNRTLTPAAQLFIDCAREVAKPLATAKSSPRR